MRTIGCGALLLISAIAPAGEKGGNGGGAFICPDSTQSLVLDLFEAGVPRLVTKDGLTIPSSDAPVEDQIQNAFKRLGTDTWVYSEVSGLYALIKQVVQQVPVPRGSIAWPADAVNPLIKPGCTPTGVILYRDSVSGALGIEVGGDYMYVDRESLSALPNQQQAALWVHETVYKYLRAKIGAEDSTLARRIVARLFSNIPVSDVAQYVEQVLRVSSLTYPPVYHPTTCPAGTKSVEIGIVYKDLDTNLNQGMEMVGTLHRADGSTLSKENGISIYNGWSTQLCLPSGQYYYEFGPRDSQGPVTYYVVSKNVAHSDPIFGGMYPSVFNTQDSPVWVNFKVGN